MDVRIIAVILLLVGFSSCTDQAKTETINLDEQESQPVNAQNVYLINCASCHGEDGKLGASHAADLSLSKLSDKEVLKMINEGNSKGMMPYKDMLSQKERESLVDYVKTLRK